MASTEQLPLEPVASQLPVKADGFMELISQAVTQGADADVVGKMLDHYERWQKMQAKKSFDEAMLNFKQSIPKIVKDQLADMNGKYSYYYADIEQVCDKLEPGMTANGFDKRWTTETSDKGIVMSCIVKHVAGHSETTMLPPAPADNSGGKNPVQAIGSSLSYLQRYSLLMAFGIAPRGIDGDGQEKKTRSKENEAEYKERCEYFAKCLSPDSLKEHWMASRKWARENDDEAAVNDFDYLKEKRKKELK